MSSKAHEEMLVLLAELDDLIENIGTLVWGEVTVEDVTKALRKIEEILWVMNG